MKIEGLKRCGIKLFHTRRNVKNVQFKKSRSGAMQANFYSNNGFLVLKLESEKGESIDSFKNRVNIALNSVECIKPMYVSPDGTIGTYGFFKRGIDMGMLRGLTVKF